MSLSATSPAISSPSSINPSIARHSTPWGLLAQLLERLIKALDLLLGFFEMVPEALREVLVRRLVDQLRQRFNDLILGVIDFLETVQEQLIHALDVFA